MNNIQIELLFQAVFQITMILGIVVLFFVITLKMMLWLSLYIRKKRISMKLKKYDLKKYNISFDSKGIPVALLDIEANKVVFI